MEILDMEIALTQERIPELLETLESETRQSRILNELGIDTEFVTELKAFISRPHETFAKMAELPVNFYKFVLAKAIDTVGFPKIISKMGVHNVGSTLSLWIFLKQEAYNYENRSAIYELIASLSNSEVLSKVKVDLLIFKEGEAELPTDFNSVEF